MMVVLVQADSHVCRGFTPDVDAGVTGAFVLLVRDECESASAVLHAEAAVSGRDDPMVGMGALRLGRLGGDCGRGGVMSVMVLHVTCAPATGLLLWFTTIPLMVWLAVLVRAASADPFNMIKAPTIEKITRFLVSII